MSELTAAERSEGTPSPVARANEWAPVIDAQVTRVGVWIFLIADLFFFAAFFFAFFYLRAMDNNKSWTPPGTTHPTIEIGALIAVLGVVAAAFYMAAMGNLGLRKSLLWLALAAGILCCAAQVYEFRNLGFDPQLGGGYPSVFVGLKGALLVQMVGALLWLSTHIAQAGPTSDLQARPASAATFSHLLWFLAGVGVIAFLVLYLF
jgi:heme/copper-type cytochrome/quinol oxidase subunit 3